MACDGVTLEWPLAQYWARLELILREMSSKAHTTKNTDIGRGFSITNVEEAHPRDDVLCVAGINMKASAPCITPLSS